MAGMRQLVDPPASTPLPYGLLSVVEFPPTSDVHWQGGITWVSHCGVGALTYDECLVVTGTGGAPPAPATKTGNLDTQFRGATPFTVYTKFDCSPVGNEQAATAGTQALLRVESFQVERGFWTGQVVAGGAELIFPHLAADATVIDAQDILLQTVPVTGTGALDPAAALGFLEDALAVCQVGQGVIHVPVAVLPTLDAWGLIKASGPRLRTLNGNLVAVGGGYPGTAPTGDAASADTSWLYATGPVIAYRGPVVTNTVRDSLDRSNNTIEMIAERTYVLGWDCCHAGVAMTLGVPVE